MIKPMYADAQTPQELITGLEKEAENLRGDTLVSMAESFYNEKHADKLLELAEIVKRVT